VQKDRTGTLQMSQKSSTSKPLAEAVVSTGTAALEAARALIDRIEII
jgi:hypothetical protein